MKTLNFGIIVFFLFTAVVFSQNHATYFTHTDTFFKENVYNGKINYKAIKDSPDKLNELLALGNKVVVNKSDPNEYRAFWVNTYNLLVIKSVVANYPLKSPLDVPGFFDRNKHEIAGENVTLNDIENKLLRAQFNNDPRFHFVLVCAGLGCPPILAEAYLPEKIEQQLTRQTLLALNDNNFIKVNAKKKRVELSQIFEWYTSDFTVNNKTLIGFINLYKTEKIPEKYKTSYYTYDWKLNDME